jgi:hypothetical protein
MRNTTELHQNFTISSDNALVHARVFDLDHGCGPAVASHQSGIEAHCLWCGRTFAPRATGGSSQKFCSPGHRQQFWIAARRWTMRAIETGLLSVDCLKAAQASVHAGRDAFHLERGA